jgi:hypothetical protein
MAGRRGPSPSEDARRRGRDAPPPRRNRYGDDADAPWLDEADYEDDSDGPTHTLIGRRTLFGLLFLLGVLTVGVVVGITLVSGRDDSPIDVPAVGEEIPVLASPGPWKRPPTGPDVDGIPVEGQGQVIYGTGDGEESEAAIDTSALPEDPMPRPGMERPATEVDALPSVTDALETDTRVAEPVPAAPVTRPAPAQPRTAKPVDTVVPRDATPAPPKTFSAKTITAPPPEPAGASGSGSTLQLGAFSTESRARSAFKSLSERYSYLAGLEPTILPVQSDGKTLYRLRTSASGAAAAKDICGRLRVAGEVCSVVN